MPLIQIESAGLGMIPGWDDDPSSRPLRTLAPALRRRIDFQDRPRVPVETPTPIAAPADWWTPIIGQWRDRPWSLSSFQDLMTSLKAAEASRGSATPVTTATATTPVTITPAPEPAGASSMFAVPSVNASMVATGNPSSSSMFATPAGTGSQNTKQSGANALSGLDDAGSTGRLIGLAAVAVLGFGLGYFGAAWAKRHWSRA